LWIFSLKCTIKRLAVVPAGELTQIPRPLALARFRGWSAGWGNKEAREGKRGSGRKGGEGNWAWIGG